MQQRFMSKKINSNDLRLDIKKSVANLIGLQRFFTNCLQEHIPIRL